MLIIYKYIFAIHFQAHQLLCNSGKTKINKESCFGKQKYLTEEIAFDVVDYKEIKLQKIT